MDESIRTGLMAKQKKLPAALLYDDLGSSLFEAITLLPEYQVARVDAAMLEAHAGEALALLPGPLEIIELGPGHGKKARLVLREVASRQESTSFVAVDVSASALEGCRRHLEDLKGVAIATIEDTFVAGLKRATTAPTPSRRVVLFLGSNLSNFDRHETVQFLRDIRACLRIGDALFLSADLEKPAARLLPAYDDALGVTAAFNKNVLLHLNRDWGANFEVAHFAHVARWNERERRIEMHLAATRSCTVNIHRLELELHFDEGETIWTESSHRFNLSELRAWGAEAGLSCAKSWVDETWPLALALFVATSPPPPSQESP